MKAILFGASGMVGQGALRECLLDPGVERVLVISRASLGKSHAKPRELVVPNVARSGASKRWLESKDINAL